MQQKEKRKEKKTNNKKKKNEKKEKKKRRDTEISKSRFLRIYRFFIEYLQYLLENIFKEYKRNIYPDCKVFFNCFIDICDHKC